MQNCFAVLRVSPKTDHAKLKSAFQRVRNLYSVLRVAPKADDSEIKSAFRSLAKAYHPDVKPGDKHAEERFKEIAQAYKFLSDSGVRKLYDGFLAQRANARQRYCRLVATMSCAFVFTSFSILFVIVGLARDPSIVAPQEFAPSSQHLVEVRKLELAPPSSTAQHSSDDRVQWYEHEIAGDAARKRVAEHVDGERQRRELTAVANVVSAPAAVANWSPDVTWAPDVTQVSARAEEKRRVKTRVVKSKEVVVAKRKQMPHDSSLAVDWRLHRWPTANEPFRNLGAPSR